MQLRFPYGDDALELTLPDGLNVNRAWPQPMAAHLSARQALRDALAKPTGARPLADVVRGKRDCLIVTTDHTRKNGYQLWLPELLDQLNTAGVPDRAIGIFVASAMRPPMSADEKLAYFGEELVRRVKLHDHDARQAKLVKAGRTDFGTVLLLNEVVCKADTLILTGGIRYHTLAGYSGGREGILPGACGMDTMSAGFKHALDREGRLLPTVRPGQLIGNPFSEDMNEACALVKPSYYFDVVLADDGGLAWVGAGDYGYVPRLAAKYYDEHRRVNLALPADVAIVGAGGGKSGSTLYRAHKSLRQVETALAPGASLVWIAACQGGEGPPQLEEWRGLSLDETRHRVSREGTLFGFAALAIRELTAAHHVHIVSKLDAELSSAWGFIPHATPDDALAAALPQSPERASWLVCEDASEVLVGVEKAAASAPKPAAAVQG